MSAVGHAAGSGVILGFVGVFLAQQFALLELNSLLTTIEYLAIAMGVGGILFGVIGGALGRRYLRKHAAPSPASA